MNIGVYAIIVKEVQRAYIGSAKRSITQRWGCHKNQLKHKTHSNPILQELYDKGYNLEYIVLELCNQKDIIERELYYYTLLRMFSNPINRVIPHRTNSN